MSDLVARSDIRPVNAVGLYCYNTGALTDQVKRITLLYTTYRESIKYMRCG